MHVCPALALLATCAWLAGAPAAAQSPAEPSAEGAPPGAGISVYGLELEVGPDRERLLIFSDAPLEPALIPVDATTLMLSLPGAVLDPTAPPQVLPQVQGTVRRVTAFDRAVQGGAPEVRVVVERRAGEPPTLERRASVVALDFPPLRVALPRPSPDGTVSIAYRATPLEQVLRDVARATGERFVYDESLRQAGRITIEGPGRATPAEALALLDSLLLGYGFAAVPAPGGGRKIVQISGAEGPWITDPALAEGDTLVTTLLRIETIQVGDLVPALIPLAGNQMTVIAYPPTNSLILSGSAARVRRLRTAVEALDRLDPGRPVIWRLRYADAEVVLEQLDLILGERSLLRGAADPATNALLLRLRPEDVGRARELVDRLDRPLDGRGELHVVKLQYARPEEMAERLTALRDDQPSDENGVARSAGLRGRAFHVVPDGPTHSLVVQAPPDVFAAVLGVVRELDRVPHSVRVEVTVGSIVLEDRLELGIEYTIPTLTSPRKVTDPIATVISSNALPDGAPLPFRFGYTRAPLLIPIVNPITGLPVLIPLPRESAELSVSGRKVRTETLVRPQLLLSSGEEHEIFAGDNIPIPVASASPTATTAVADETGAVADVGVGTGFEVRQDIQRQDVGTSLRITPTVGAEGGVVLELSLEVSELVASAAGDLEEVGPTIRQIVVDSRIHLRQGELAIVATAAQPVQTRSETGVPWLREIPFLGWAFRSNRDSVARRYLLVAVQAEIVSEESRELARALVRELVAQEQAEAGRAALGP